MRRSVFAGCCDELDVESILRYALAMAAVSDRERVQQR